MGFNSAFKGLNLLRRKLTQGRGKATTPVFVWKKYAKLKNEKKIG